jgi:hypothetical protein
MRPDDPGLDQVQVTDSAGVQIGFGNTQRNVYIERLHVDIQVRPPVSDPPPPPPLQKVRAWASDDAPVLPDDGTPFIRRRRLAARFDEAARDADLLCVFGEPGTGKTRIGPTFRFASSLARRRNSSRLSFGSRSLARSAYRLASCQLPAI